MFVDNDSHEASSGQQDVASATLNHFVLSDLRKYTNYSIEIAPFNRAGPGPSQKCNAQTYPDRPGPVGNLVFLDIQLDSVNVSWTAPAEPNGIIIGYVITYKTYKLEEGLFENEKQALPLLINFFLQNILNRFKKKQRELFYRLTIWKKM